MLNTCPTNKQMPNICLSNKWLYAPIYMACASVWSSRPVEDDKFCAIKFEKGSVLSNLDAASHWISAYLKDKNRLSNLEVTSHWINASLKTFV